MNEILAVVLPVIAGVVAGITWSTLGIWSKYRSGGEKAVDVDKLKKNLAVGGGTGFASYIYAIATNASIPTISDFGGFVAAVAAYFTLVVVVDKLLMARDDVIPDDE